MSPHKYPFIPDIGLVVHETFGISFDAFQWGWFFAIPISSQAYHVIAIEPAPANYEMLCRNVKRNSCENVTPIHSAMSSIDGEVELNLGVSGTTGHSVTSKKRSGPHTTVPSCSLMTAVTRWGPTVLKLGCEGAEWVILTDPGLLQGIRIIVAELHKVTGTKLHALEQAGYQYTIKSNGWFSKLIAHKEI